MLGRSRLLRTTPLSTNLLRINLLESSEKRLKLLEPEVPCQDLAQVVLLVVVATIQPLTLSSSKR